MVQVYECMCAAAWSLSASSPPPLSSTGPLAKPDLCHHLPAAKHFLPAPSAERARKAAEPGSPFKPTNHSPRMQMLRSLPHKILLYAKQRRCLPAADWMLSPSAGFNWPICLNMNTLLAKAALSFARTPRPPPRLDSSPIPLGPGSFLLLPSQGRRIR